MNIENNHKTDYERLEALYEYLSTLGYIADTYTCNKEIGECINAIRTELGIDG